MNRDRNSKIALTEWRAQPKTCRIKYKGKDLESVDM